MEKTGPVKGRRGVGSFTHVDHTLLTHPQCLRLLVQDPLPRKRVNFNPGLSQISSKLCFLIKEHAT